MHIVCAIICLIIIEWKAIPYNCENKTNVALHQLITFYFFIFSFKDLTYDISVLYPDIFMYVSFPVYK